MQLLRAVTKGILKRVEELSGKSIQFMRDEKLPLLATLQLARHGADFHVLRYRPSNEPLDYVIAYQAGFVLRLFQNEPDRRFDFSPAASASKNVEVLLTTGQPLGETERKVLPDYSKFIAQWALMNLRSLPVGMRIDAWLAAEHPELRELQANSIASQQQENMNILSQKVGKLTVPTALLGPVAAYAQFADRMAGSRGFIIPFEAAGLLDQGIELLDIWDSVPADPTHDRELTDRWASATGTTDWFKWIPYQP